MLEAVHNYSPLGTKTTIIRCRATFSDLRGFRFNTGHVESLIFHEEQDIKIKLTASVDARQASRTGCAAHTETVPTTEVDCAETREMRVNVGKIERYITARMYLGMFVVSNCLMSNSRKYC